MHRAEDTVFGPQRNRHTICSVDCQREIGLRCHNRIGLGPYCSVDSNLIAIDATVAMHLLKPHPPTVGDSIAALILLR